MKRNLVCLFALVVFGISSTAQADDETGFKSLFDGKTLKGWDGNPKFWSVKDGAITGQTTKENVTKGNTFIIWKDGTVADFELRLSYKIVNGNSGIQYRSKDYGKWVVGGYQADFEAGKTYSGILYEERGRGILAKRGDKVEIDAKGKKKVVGSLGKSADIQAVIKNERLERICDRGQRKQSYPFHQRHTNDRSRRPSRFSPSEIRHPSITTSRRTCNDRAV